MTKNMNNEEHVYSIGPDFIGTLFLVFLVLKLTHVIDWSWWWVTSPLWIPLGIGLLGILIATVWYWIGNITE